MSYLQNSQKPGRRASALAVFGVVSGLAAFPAGATAFSFSTGNPDGLMASRAVATKGISGSIQTETADDFVLTQSTMINHATFTGLLPSGAPLSDISNVEIEFYHVFPLDSTNPPSGKVPTRVNSPSDVEIASATRDGIAGTLSFSASILSASFTALNSVVNGIHPKPNQTTLGEGPVTGEEVLFDIIFNTPVVLGADHYFFRPEALLSSGDFLWLSAPKPIVAPGTPFAPDLQSWIRDDNLAPDWLRIGTDIIGPPPTGGLAPTFNAAFSLSGTVPEPGTLALLGIGGLSLVGLNRRTRRAQGMR